MSIGSRIREARKARKMTQGQLAKKVGMSQGSLSELETGESAGTTNLAAIAHALQADAYWLETGKGEMAIRAASQAMVASLSWLTPQEMDLLTLFRATDDEGRGSIMDAARSVKSRLAPPSDLG